MSEKKKKHLVFKVECGPEIDRLIIYVLEHLKRGKIIEDYLIYG